MSDLLEATFAYSAADVDSPVMVRIPSFDGGEHDQGPVIWSPGPGGELPHYGGRALVVEAQAPDGVWSWWVVEWEFETSVAAPDPTPATPTADAQKRQIALNVAPTVTGSGARWALTCPADLIAGTYVLMLDFTMYGSVGITGYRISRTARYGQPGSVLLAAPVVVLNEASSHRPVQSQFIVTPLSPSEQIHVELYGDGIATADGNDRLTAAVIG